MPSVRTRLHTRWHTPFVLLLSACAPLRAQPATGYQATVLSIQAQMEAGQLTSARAAVGEALRHYPSDGGLENLLGVVEVQQGHRQEAMNAFSAAVRHKPALTGASLNLARLYLEQQPPAPDAADHALALYRKVLLREPAQQEAAFGAASILAERKQYAASLEPLQKLSPAAQDNLAVRELMCTDEAALHRDGAATQAAEALAADPHFNENEVMRMTGALREARRADLIEKLLTAAEQHAPLSPAGVRLLGLAQEAEQHLPEARATLERAYTMDGGSATCLVDLTRIAIAMHDTEGAMGYLAHARAIAPKDPALAYEFGVLCLRQNLLGEARKAMEEAVQLAPDNAEYLFGMGTVTTFAQDPLQAVPYLEKYRALRPKDPAGALGLGLAYYRGEEFERAAAPLQEAASNPLTAGRAHYYLGSALSRKGRREQAVAEFGKALSLLPEDADVYAALGQVKLGEHNYGEAEENFSHALRIDRDNYAANFGLLQVYAHAGDPRREEQAKRFEAVKSTSEERSREAMRVIEARPEPALAAVPPSQ